MKKLIDAYLYKIINNNVQFLVLKRSNKTIYAGQWRMIGGKVKAGETYWQAAQREVDEELSITPQLFWSVPTINRFYEPETDEIHVIPPFAVQLKKEDKFVLNYEHSEYSWIETSQIDEYIKWPEQRRIMKLINEIVTEDEILEDWIINI